MKCKHCNGTGKIRGYFYEKTGVNKWEKVWGDSPCDECNGTGEIKITNDEWRKTCSTEEFAEFLNFIAFDWNRVDKQWVLEWLKQPHTKE